MVTAPLSLPGPDSELARLTNAQFDGSLTAADRDRPPPVSPARGPPTDWGEFVQVHDDRAIFQASSDELPVIDIHSL